MTEQEVITFLQKAGFTQDEPNIFIKDLTKMVIDGNKIKLFDNGVEVDSREISKLCIITRDWKGNLHKA